MSNSQNTTKPSLKEKFLDLKKAWLKETLIESSSDKICSNENYQEIIRLGFQVVPLIIEDMKKEPHHWFQALTKITNVDPTMPYNRGDLNKMTKDWLDYWNYGKDLKTRNEY